jgi:putative exosortase-associated protein (TIGR04073 family)
MKKMLVLVLVAVFMLSGLAYAADAPAAPKAGATKTHPAGPIQKLERGFGNAAFGWSEIPKRIVDTTKSSNPIQGLLVGTWQGTCKAFARTASGIFDVATFPVAGYDKAKITPDMPAATK